MTAKPVIVCTGIVLLALAGGMAWSNANRRAAADSERAIWAERCERVTRELRRAEERLALAEAERAKQAAETKRKRAAGKPSETPPKSIVRRVPNIAERLRSDPVTQVLWLQSRRAQLAARYGPLLRKLNVSTAQRAAFEAAMIRKDEETIDLRAAEAAQGLSASDPVLKTLHEQIANEHQSALRSALGEEGLQELKDYERTMGIRDIVNGVAGGAVVVGRAPLSVTQGEQLIEIIANTSKSYREGGAANPNEIHWDAVDMQAQRILSAEQFSFLKDLEPPLPIGARNQAQMYQLLEEARKADAARGSDGEAVVASPSKPGK